MLRLLYAPASKTDASVFRCESGHLIFKV